MKVNIILEIEMPEDHNNDRDQAQAIMKKVEDAVEGLLDGFVEKVQELDYEVFDCYVDSTELGSEEQADIDAAELAEAEQSRIDIEADQRADYNDRIRELG